MNGLSQKKNPFLMNGYILDLVTCFDNRGFTKHYNAKIVPFTGCFDVCKITNPDKIRSLLVEILLEMIDALAVFIVFVRMKRLLGRHLWQLKRFHQAVHSSDADVNAIITPKNMGDFICSKPFVIVGIDVKNLGSNHLIFFGSVSWC